MFAEGGNCRNIGKGVWELSPNFFLDEEPSIPEGFQNLICEYFNQVDASNTKQMSGKYLGLSIAKIIVEGHDRKINHETEIGRRTTFFFDLPQALQSAIARGFLIP
jgi:two-component system sensor histidine kinase RpfC